MRKFVQMTVVFLGICFFGCDSSQEVDEESLLGVDELGHLIKQGDITGHLSPFELVDQPAYAPVFEVGYIRDDELVFITKACGLVQVFPHRNMHVEVVNDITHGTAFAITYCPITRSGISWNRVVDGDTLLLTASGYLYKENLMPLDLRSESLWSQMKLKGMSGKHAQKEIHTFPLIETTWKTVREYFPGAMVFVTPSSLKAASQATLSQELGLVSREGLELFSMEQFPGEVGIIQTVVYPGGRTLVLGSSEHHYMTAFITTYDMEEVEGQFPVVMKDETGSYWNLFGEAVSGERGGEKLPSPTFFTAARWAWLDLYEQVAYFN